MFSFCKMQFICIILSFPLPICLLIKSIQASELSKEVLSKSNLLTEDDIRIFNHKTNSTMPREPDGIHFTNVINKNLVDGDDEYDIVQSAQQWPSGEVPFVIANDETLHEEFFEQFGEAVEDFHQNTCVKFRPKLELDHFFIRIFNGEGCWSYVGMQSELIYEGQEVSLGPECWRKGIILHELMHVLGFFHEHSRFDRDQFIELNVRNIQKNRIRQFDKRPKEHVDEVGSYDFGSIMHYERNAFAVDKRTHTIVPKLNREGTLEMGQRIRLSVVDIQKINRLYNCTTAATKQEQGNGKPHHHRFPSGARHIQERNVLAGTLPFTQTFIFSGNSLQQQPTSYSSYFNAQKNSEGTPIGFKTSQDFFIRTGLKPAGPGSYSVQLPDGSYLLSSPPVPTPSSAGTSGGSVDDNNSYNQPYSFNSTVTGAQFWDNSALPAASSSNHFLVHSPPVHADTIVCENAAQANCVDRKNDCVELAQNGECDKKPGLMLRMCRRSCCNCDDLKCYDTKDEQKYATLCLAQNRQSNSVVLSACDVPETKQNALDYCPRTCGTCDNYPAGGLAHKTPHNTP